MALRAGSEPTANDRYASSSHLGRQSQEFTAVHMQPAAHSVQFPSLPAPHVGGEHFSEKINSTGARGRTRTMSLSEHTQEAVRVIAPPVSVPLVVLCMLWYLTSAVSSNLGKAILSICNYPVSLTMAQFVYAFIFGVGATFMASHHHKLADIVPRGTVSTSGVVGFSRHIFVCTAPMAGFQIAGHLLGHSATSQIPVSLVHAIKALSPLFTVSAYTILLGVRYNTSTYLSLIPLTSGVMMTCAAEFKVRPLAILYAILAACIFVAQNMWSKGLLTNGSSGSSRAEGSREERSSGKLDKLTILYSCAAFGFIGTLPIWISSDGVKLARHGFVVEGSLSHLFLLYTFNGFSHFCQNLLSFMILGSITPVAYSIASLLKRIVVIAVAILWFGQRVTSTQGWGIIITFVGLYIYDRFGSKKQLPSRSLLPT